jgi:hypothetical protein
MPARKDATVLRHDEVASLLALACGSLPEKLLRQKHAELPAQWAEVRRVVALLPDEPRRACLLALLTDERARLTHERIASWSGGALASVEVED